MAAIFGFKMVNHVTAVLTISRKLNGIGITKTISLNMPMFLVVGRRWIDEINPIWLPPRK